MSDFAGLRIALSALYAQRRGLELTGHNVANANTEGYSRQRIDMVNAGAPAVPAFWSKWMGDGAGVQVEGTIRYRDQFLEIRAALEHAAQAKLDRRQDVLGSLEDLFGEPGDMGISKQLSEFWAGWDDVANHPNDSAARSQLLERAATAASSFNEAATNIATMRTNAITELDALVSDVNATAATVAQLNEAIKSARIAGLSSNDLEDQRDLMVNQLATKTGATIRPGDWGAVNVFVGGTALVFENRSEQFELDTSGASVVLRFETGGFVADVTSGDAGGLLEVINDVLPGYLAGLDDVANQLRDDVNDLHSSITGSLAAADRDQSASGALDFELALNGGAFANVSVAGADWSGAGGDAALQAALQAAVDAAVGAGNATVTVTGAVGSPLEISIEPTGTNTLLVQASGANVGFETLLGTTGIGLDGVGGRRFFEGTGATDLAVSADITGTDAVAAGVAAGGPYDGSRALELAELTGSSAGADALYRSYIVDLGVDSQTTQRRKAIQDETTNRLDVARDAAAGVDIDEEMVNMVQFQHAYDAAARFMTTIDQMLDKLINATGRVGL